MVPLLPAFERWRSSYARCVAAAQEQPDEHERRLAALRGVLTHSRNGTEPRALQLGQLLGELDAWLADDRQWSRGGARHWRTLVDDVIERLRWAVTLVEGTAQAAWLEHARELRELRGLFEHGFDEALRRRMRRWSAGVRAVAGRPELLVLAWRRLGRWAVEDPRRAAAAIGVWRDLAELQGHDAAELLGQFGLVLADNRWAIRAIDGSEPAAGGMLAGRTAGDRLALVETRLGQPPHQVDGLVWLEYLQARLNWPWTLELGPVVTLYDHAFLRSMIHQAPDDERVPPELRGDRASGILAQWLSASDRDEATRADHEVPGDPRVYLRLQFGTMPPAQLLAAARETAEFLVGFGMLYSDAHDIWQLGDSHYIAGHAARTSYMTLNADKARDELGVDTTAVELGRNADALGPHLPLTDPRLRVAGRLLVWMRQATANDDPARLVLCDRVIEQVCGWAGMTDPARFVTDHLKPSWIYWQIRGTAQNGYWQVQPALDDDPLRRLIETDAGQPPHSAGNHLPTTNTKAILEHLDELIALGVDPRAEAAALIEFRERTTDGAAAARWLDELATEFDRRAARLRRTRNALMHGGPLVPGTVEDVARFATLLARDALGGAVRLLLEDCDVVDGFLDAQQRTETCFAQLRAGVPPSEALFWGG